LALAVPWAAFAAELDASEVEGSVNDVTVVQGTTSNFNIRLQASGNMSCSITSSNASTASVKTSYSIAQDGTTSSSNFSSQFPFWGAGSGPCQVTWTNAPTP